VQNLKEITNKLIDGDNIAIFIYSICTSKAALDSEINKVRIKKLLYNIKIKNILK